MEDVNKFKQIWIKSPEERLNIIREFRKNYSYTTVNKLCDDVWRLWTSFPENSKMVDPYDITTWLTFWELIHLGETCKYTKAVAASYLIHYINPDLEVVICRVFDKDQNDIYIASLINNEYILLPYNQEVVHWNMVESNIEIRKKWPIGQVIDIINHRVNL